MATNRRRKPHPTLACAECGCTEKRACPGGCAWYSVNPPLCTTCYVRRATGGLEAMKKAARQSRIVFPDAVLPSGLRGFR